jgi:hypothetical protein
MGHLIPAGTGFGDHRNIAIAKHALETKDEAKAEGGGKEGGPEGPGEGKETKEKK